MPRSSDQKPPPDQQQSAPASMSQYLHATLHGLVDLPTLPPHHHDNNSGDGPAESGTTAATGATVEERIGICDAFGRYAAGDFAGGGGGGGGDGTSTAATAAAAMSSRPGARGMMSHGAVDGYLDLHPGGVVGRSAAATASAAAGNNDTGGGDDALPSPVRPAGGIALPPLDWNASFRKGYSVQVWVRPHLCRRPSSGGPDGQGCCCHTTNNNSNNSNNNDENNGGGSADQDRDGPGGPASAAAAAAAEALRQTEMDRPRVLYRFATSPDNESAGAGVCALLAKWTAHERPASSDGAEEEDGGGGDNEDDDNEDEDEKKAGGGLPEERDGDGGRRDITHLQTTLTVYTLPHHKSNPVFFVPNTKSGGGGGAAGWDSPGKSPLPRRDGDGSFFDDDTPSMPSIGGGGGRGGDDRLHEANMQRFEQQQQMHRSQDAASLATATLVLPSDEWSLVGINHVMPYLKRPQISICVNGDQVMKAELGYPQLDPAHVPPPPAASAAAASSGGSGGGGQGRSSPSLGFRAGGAGGMTQVLKQAEELPPGWMGHCTVLDNSFGFDGVRIKGTEDTYAPYHMHVASLSLYSEPISSTVQAIVAEFGPNSPPGMVMPPVPCVVQNRDSVVTDGHHSGHSSGSSGRGGSGGGIAVGRGHKSGRSIGLATSIGVLPPSGHGRESLRVNIDGGGELNLQKAVGKCVLGWSFVDAVSLGNDKVPSSTPSSSSGSLTSKASGNGSGAVGPGRLVCPPSRYNSSIGKADDVPKGV
jgi:hypothetical protein